MPFSRHQALLCSVSLLAVGAVLAAPARAQTPPATQSYLAGDFHNHTTCSDGSVAIPTLINRGVTTFGLEWFAQSGHGGANARDCRFDDPLYDGGTTGDGGKLFVDTIAQINPLGFLGDPVFTTGSTGNRGSVQAMWKWQSLQDNVYPLVAERQRALGRLVFAGLEQNAPGHEHADSSIIVGQLPRARSATGNVRPLSEFEYRFDRTDSDMSGGNGPWPGKQANPSGAAASVPGAGLDGHAKALSGIAFMQAGYPTTAYNVPTHPERNGPFKPNNNDGSGGWNVENFRDYNNAGPTVTFGFDSQPGHQATSARGAYGTGASGGGTYGGTGVYAAQIGGLWDSLLGEGRNWWLFANSDFHNRGSFGPFAPASTADFFPGEFQRTYLPPGSNLSPQRVVDAMRAGNTFTAMGALITKDFSFTACTDPSNCATMGQTLVVPAGAAVTVTMTVTLPTGPNFSPYSFPNPVLAQIGVNEPINQPNLDHIDLIGGLVTGPIPPATTGAYVTPTNPSTALLATFPRSSFTVNGQTRTISYTIPAVTAAQYVRARGTNLPPATPFATDSAGNPLNDFGIAGNVPCNDAACPAHLPVRTINGVATKAVDVDVRAWATPWFYANPIYMRPAGSPELLAETNARLARTLAGLN